MKNNKKEHRGLITDKELFSAISEGNHEAFRKFFDSYKKRIYGFLYSKLHSHEVVEELLQVVFVKTWENRATINPNLSPDAYVLKIAKNSALNFLRQKAYKLLLEKQLIEKINIAEDGETSFVDEDLKRHIDDLVAHIPERRREIFKLRYEKELSYKEIAEKLSISESTVNTQISLALNYLRKQLGKELWAVTLPLITFFSILKI
ncbi:MAG: RNA polymerase sigma-70 factor [Bacteroidales bacterium]|nr:RNA polymerase sigma-70 factor [Bacteroidales bacterium]